MRSSHRPSFNSRLPNVGTTVFSTMSALAAQHGAVNLGQGFPDFDCDPRLVAAVNKAMQAGVNQYAPLAGLPQLRQAVADKIARLYGHSYDANTEITVTAGATQAILTAVLAVVHPGDEVLLLDPSYDSYAPAVALAGGVAVRLPLVPRSFRPDLGRIAAALTPRTRLLIINSPHNPSGTVWSEQEMQQLQELLAPTPVLLLSDEVYEHMVFDGRRHESVSRYPQLAARSFVVSSFGKTFHVTGWKVGTVAAPSELSAEFRKIHQFNVFAVNAPMQAGLADYLQDPAPYEGLAAFYQRKRDFFRNGLQGSRFGLIECSGTYFQTVDYSAISSLPEAAFCEWLIKEVGVAAIPTAAFYENGFEQTTVRFCFAKQEATLERALQLLRKL